MQKENNLDSDEKLEKIELGKRVKKVHKFENGAVLNYYYTPDENRTQMSAYFEGGANYDIVHKGTAHFAEHLLFQEIPGIKRETLKTFLKENDVNQNAFTSSYYVATDFDFPSKVTKQIFDLHTKMFTKRMWNGKVFNNEKQVVTREIEMYEGTNRNILGTTEDVQKIRQKEILSYFDKVFNAKNCQISISSNLDFEQIIEYAQDFSNSLYEGKKANQTKVRKEVTGGYLDINKRTNCKTIKFYIDFISDESYKNNQILGYFLRSIIGSLDGRLGEIFREKKGVAYFADYAYSFDKYRTQKGNHCFNISTNNAQLENVFDGVIKLFNDLKTKGLTKKEFEEAKNRLNVVLKNRNMVSVDTFTEGVLSSKMGLKITEEDYKNATLEDVNALIKNLIANANWAMGLSGNIDLKKVPEYDEMSEFFGIKEYDCFHDKAMDIVIDREKSFMPASNNTDEENTLAITYIVDDVIMALSNLSEDDYYVIIKDQLKERENEKFFQNRQNEFAKAIDSFLDKEFVKIFKPEIKQCLTTKQGLAVKIDACNNITQKMYNANKDIFKKYDKEMQIEIIKNMAKYIYQKLSTLMEEDIKKAITKNHKKMITALVRDEFKGITREERAEIRKEMGNVTEDLLEEFEDFDKNQGYVEEETGAFSITL